MQYVQHDFARNVAMLHTTGQTDKAKSMVMSEIAQLIIYHRGHVIQSLNEAGIQTSKYASDEELTEKLSKNLSENKNLQGSISHWLIVLNSPMQPTPKRTYGADAGGIGAGAGKTPNVTVGADPVSAIAGAIGSAFSFFGSKQDGKNQAEQNKMQLAQALLAGKPTKKSNTGTYVLVAAIVAAAGLGIYFFMRHKKSSALVHHSPSAPAALPAPAPTAI